MRPNSRNRGFSLIEVVIVLSMMATLTAMALPNMLDVRDQTALTNAAHVFARDLNRARVEAVRINATVAVVRQGTQSYEIDGKTLYTLPDGVSFAPGFESVEFVSFGPVATGAGIYELVLGSHRKAVRIESTGFASVQR